MQGKRRIEGGSAEEVYHAREPVVVPSEEKSRQQMVSLVNGVAYLETAMMPFSLTRRALSSKMVPWRSASITGSCSALARTIVM